MSLLHIRCLNTWPVILQTHCTVFNHNNIIYFVVYIYIILEFIHHCCPFCQSEGIDFKLVVYVAVGAAGGIIILFVIILILCSRQNSSYSLGIGAVTLVNQWIS